MPATLCEMYVETEERKFRYKSLACSDEFTNLLKTFSFFAKIYVECLWVF